MAAVAQHEQLQHYEREYQQSFASGPAGQRYVDGDLINQQSFILSLNQVVKQHESHVSTCEQAVDRVKEKWLQKSSALMRLRRSSIAAKRHWLWHRAARSKK